MWGAIFLYSLIDESWSDLHLTSLSYHIGTANLIDIEHFIIPPQGLSLDRRCISYRHRARQLVPSFHSRELHPLIIQGRISTLLLPLDLMGVIFCNNNQDEATARTEDKSLDQKIVIPWLRLSYQHRRIQSSYTSVTQALLGPFGLYQ